jgi:hypothetical protein
MQTNIPIKQIRGMSNKTKSLNRLDAEVISSARNDIYVSNVIFQSINYITPQNLQYLPQLIVHRLTTIPFYAKLKEGNLSSPKLSLPLK